MNFSYREIDVSPNDLFPRIDLAKVRRDFSRLVRDNPHETILNVARELWNGGYETILREDGFWDTDYPVFGGHCHQCTPSLGVVLHALGFKAAYLECQRIREHFEKTGLIEKVDPKEEQSQMNEQFCKIERIPYCCLEVTVNGGKYYLTGKHLRSDGDKTKVLLAPLCYTGFVGVLHHPDDVRKSGIYLRTVKPEKNPQSVNFSRQVVWTKQTSNDPNPEYFATFLRMNLI